MPKVSGTSIRTKRYDRFRGVDFSTDPALVDDARSPWAPNMVADKGGMPEKRPGWRTLVELEGRINGLHTLMTDSGEQLLVHAGERLYLEKAMALADLLTRRQDDDGRFPTFFEGENCEHGRYNFWINCHIHTASILQELADLTEAEGIE